MKTHYFSLTLLCILLANTSRAAVVLDFEALPVPGSGFFNGNNRPGNDPYRGNFQVLGQQNFSFGTEFQQLWTLQPASFNNNYLQGNSFDSWSGFSWSNVIDTTTSGFGNQYAAITGGGSNGAGGVNPGETYAIAFGATYFNIADDLALQSIDVTNGTYGFLSMRDGDFFAKRFGGVSGDDPDLFQVTFTGFNQPGGAGGGGDVTGSVTIDLADFRFADNSQDFILDSWTNVDMMGLGRPRSVGVSYFSTDVDPVFGINTPRYVAVDNLRFVPEPSLWGMLMCSLGLASFRRSRSSHRS